MHIVKEYLKKSVEGSAMFRLLMKLKRLERGFKKLNKKEFWNISKRVQEARDVLGEVES